MMCVCSSDARICTTPDATAQPIAGSRELLARYGALDLCDRAEVRGSRLRLIKVTFGYTDVEPLPDALVLLQMQEDAAMWAAQPDDSAAADQVMGTLPAARGAALTLHSLAPSAHIRIEVEVRVPMEVWEEM